MRHTTVKQNAILIEVFTSFLFTNTLTDFFLFEIRLNIYVAIFEKV